MASLPREIYIQQRKRRHNEVDDAPAFLQIDNDDPISKRRMSGNFVYKRRNPKEQPSPDPAVETRTPPTELAPPVIKTKQPNVSQKTPSAAATSDGPAVTHEAATDIKKDASPPPPAGGLAPSTRPIFQPRRFHMSRSLMSKQGLQPSKSGPQGISKKRYTTAVFIERAAKRVQQFDTDTMDKSIDQQHPDVDMSDSSTRKRPSARRLKPKTTAAGVASSAPATAPPASIPVDHKPLPNIAPTANPDQLAQEMDKWVLHEIGLNLKEMKESTAAAVPKKKATATNSKFKPKAPAKRFAERHPELSARLNAENNRQTADIAMQDVDVELSDDDYEIVVYELAPNDDRGALGSIPPEQIGFLKFDSREDMELFYGNEDDDSDWMPEDDEDENAENHYTAEYPEELDSDDSEFDGGRGAAHRGRGAYDDDYEMDDQDNVAAYYRSDLKEFDGEYADDEDEDRYVVEGDDEYRDRDAVFQENIRRYIQRYGSN